MCIYYCFRGNSTIKHIETNRYFYLKKMEIFQKSGRNIVTGASRRASDLVQ